MFLFSNLAVSLDGKIAPAHGPFFFLGTPFDRRTMLVLRKQSDAILMGASTLRVFKRPCLSRGQNEPANVILSTALEGISPSWPFFKSQKIRRILILRKKPPSSLLSKFEKTSEIVILPSSVKKGSVGSKIIQTLESRGIRRLLIEGGGTVMWEFAKQNLIDEYHVTLTPRILGGANAPTLVDGEGFNAASALSLKLVKCRRVKDELYLTYIALRARQ